MPNTKIGSHCYSYVLTDQTQIHGSYRFDRHGVIQSPEREYVVVLWCGIWIITLYQRLEMVRGAPSCLLESGGGRGTDTFDSNER